MGKILYTLIFGLIGLFFLGCGIVGCGYTVMFIASGLLDVDAGFDFSKAVYMFAFIGFPGMIVGACFLAGVAEDWSRA